ncbi:MAG: hypothetical protein DMG82_24585 [Acidobacteria bacterium]|nr:MAG: hypothetical protein DMG82_24585 [Acidobacteriota bacterium]PYX40576.1 MAG: hypothetical protein DMG83_26370 [Acidobacteriota bacterium]
MPTRIERISPYFRVDFIRVVPEILFVQGTFHRRRRLNQHHNSVTLLKHLRSVVRSGFGSGALKKELRIQQTRPMVAVACDFDIFASYLATAISAVLLSVWYIAKA